MSALVTMLLAACSGPSEPADAPDPPDTSVPTPADTWVAEAPLEALRERLEAEGWTVQEGGLTAIGLEDCCLFDSCHNRNPTAHYVMYDLPVAEGEAERILDDAIPFRITPDEAVVFVGRIPPPARYVSFRSYVHRRFDAATGQSEVAYLNLGDSLNQHVLGHWGDSGTAPFEATTVVITVADAGVERTVRALLEEAGFPAEVINTDPIPTDRVQLGLDARSDSLRMNLRVSKFEDPGLGEAWLEDPPGVVLRIRPPTPPTPEPIPPSPTRRAGGGPTELHLEPAMDALRDAVAARYDDRLTLPAAVAWTQPPDDDWCAPGCNRDSTYGLAQGLPMPLSDTIDVIVYGVNHQATGLVEYANAFVFGLDNEDPAGFVDTPSMTGSAAAFLPDHPDVDQLYAWRFSRDCTGDPFCSEVSSGCPGLEEGEGSAIGFRTYLDPRTGTHADLAELVLDEALFVYKDAGSTP